MSVSFVHAMATVCVCQQVLPKTDEVLHLDQNNEYSNRWDIAVAAMECMYLTISSREQ